MKFHEDDRRQSITDIFSDMPSGQVNISYIPPNGSVVFGHWHKEQTDYWFVLKGGPLKVVLTEIDERNSYETIAIEDRIVLGNTEIHYLSDKNIKILEIPPKIIHGYKNVSSKEVILLYYLSHKYNIKDEFKVPWDFLGEEIWDVENK